MSSRIFIVALIVLAFGAAVSSATPPATISLNAGSAHAESHVHLVDRNASGLTLKFTATGLNAEEVVRSGQVFRRLSFPGGGMLGSVDQPGLPTVTHLVALPAGSGVEALLVDQVEVSLGSMRLAPNEPIAALDRQSPPFDAGRYESTPASRPAVVVGTPALLHGLRVVPVTFCPVGYDPATGATVAAAEMTVEVSFSGTDTRNDSRGEARLLPESFATIFEQTVLGWERGDETQVGPGSMIYICPPSALGYMNNLAKWRARQGYNVEVVSTSVAGTTANAIRYYLQDRYDTMDPPLEFVTLVGDANGSLAVPTFFENASGYYGEGDHDYSRLDGNDVLADVHVGRLTAQNPTQLTGIINKILDYEQYPDMSDVRWFTRAGLTGDPSSSGESCIYTNQFFKQELLRLNYTQVDTIWSGDFVGQMTNTLNQGETFFTYRGLGGMSGMSTGHISYLSNGRKLPFAIILTCDTGSFSDDTTCRSEAFLRNTNGGGIASIGTATNGTHTRYNNCMFLGITDHITGSGDFRVGPALTRGKLNFYANYWQTEQSKVWTWSTWNNLMGDPATEIWTGVPQLLTVNHPDQVSTSADAVAVTVQSEGQAVAGAQVALYQSGVLRSVGFTDDQGRVVLDVAAAVSGDVNLTVTGHNLYPYQGVVAVGQVDRSLEFASLLLPGGSLLPGQSTELSIEIANSGTNTVPDAEATLSGNLDWLDVDTSPVSFGNVDPGGTAWSQDDFGLTVTDLAPGGGEAVLELLTTSGEEAWISLVRIPVSGPRVDSAQPAWNVPGGTPDPGENGSMTFAFDNLGNLASSGFTGVLTCDSYWVDVISDQGTWGSMPIGESAAQQVAFAVTATAACYPGHLANFTLELTFNEGGRQILQFQQVIGTSNAGDPTGPDAYGYYAFDNSDSDPLAPEYEWVDIALQGAPDLGIADNDRYGDQTEVVELPFPFTYYGREYESISVCSNGWLSFGATDLKFYRNWYLPANGSPDAMVAAFWTDLAQGHVFAKHDTQNHRFVIQWSDFGVYYQPGDPYTGYYDGSCTFQIILMDPAYHATDTGDGIIVMQYNSVTVSNYETNLFTAGIQNADRDVGQTYFYGGSYAGGAAAIEQGRAIAWRTIRPQPQSILAGQVVTDSPSPAPVPQAHISLVGNSTFFISDETGHYGGSVPAGIWDVAFSHPGCDPDTVRDVTMVEAVTTQLDQSLTDSFGPEFTELVLPTTTDDTGGPYLVEATINDVSGVAEMAMHYTSSTQGGPLTANLEEVDGQPGHYRALLPGQAIGTLVQYWLTAQDDLGQTSQSPLGAPWPVHSFQVAEGGAYLDEDFEASSGWVVDADGQDDAGSGIWTWGDPIGTDYDGNPVQTENDHTAAPGVNAWFTGQHQIGESAGYNDVDGGATSLTSPTYDLNGLAEVTISYWRWFTNNAGSSPDQDIWDVRISNDGGTSWTIVENTTVSNASWQQVVVDLSDHYAAPGQLKLRFTASDEGSGSLVEAAIDDLQITATSLTADTDSPTVVLASPNGGESVQFGQPMSVSWQAGDDTGVVEARLALSVDGGATYGESLLTGPFNGACEWTVLAPATVSDQARLQVQVLDAAGRTAADASDGDFNIVGGVAASPAPALLMALGQNHPNPFNPQTDIVFSLPHRMDTTLSIYDVQGRLVRILVHEERAAGAHRVTWKGRNETGGAVASGTYFYRLTTESGTLVRKMTLLK